MMQRRQKVLADFGDFALQSEDLDEVLHEACRLVSEALGTVRAKVLEIENGGESLFVRAGVDWAPDVVGHIHVPMGENSSESFSIREGEPVVSKDIAREDRFDMPPFMKEAGVVALANVPIFLPGRRAYGLLQVDDTQPRDFDSSGSQFLRTYAIILGPIVDRLLQLDEFRNSEARRRLLQPNWETDALGVVTTDSPSWRAHTGQTLEEWLGYGWLDAVHPDDRPYAERQWREAVAAHKTVDDEFRLAPRMANGAGPMSAPLPFTTQEARSRSGPD
ncbi:GAF domain-containing protein [Paracoccus sp. TK19116]|uniref:GAF domain-containing protein n=1 Tax=Paracoccus albicereus TaxID=2922394 RepID=A0ABT1MVA3_9RHOB|nr:GAF domain-containing protein [Paracoccus albicereus]MCQ0972263.1 GAF domain-containing protein [Paracoccus albicereus]